MSAAFKFRGEKYFNDFKRITGADDLFAQRKHIGVIVQPCKFRAIGIVAVRAAYAGNFICNDRYAYARRTDYDSPFKFAARNGFRRGKGVVGVVTAILGICSEVPVFVAVFVEVFNNFF